jgi:hypothetical protein
MSSIAVSCSIGLTHFFVPDPPPRLSGKAHQSFSAHLIELDAHGAITGILGLVLFNFAWNQAAISGWGSPECITTLVLGVACMLLFAWIEMQWAPAPLIPFQALNSAHGFIVLAIFGGWASFAIWFYYAMCHFGRPGFGLDGSAYASIGSHSHHDVGYDRLPYW